VTNISPIGIRYFSFPECDNPSILRRSFISSLDHVSTTDGSSTPSSIFDDKSRDESKTTAFSTQLKKLYRDISLLVDLGELQDGNRIVIKSCPSTGTDEAEKARWKKAIEDHK
jgi:hypothetical protein